MDKWFIDKPMHNKSFLRVLGLAQPKGCFLWHLNFTSQPRKLSHFCKVVDLMSAEGKGQRVEGRGVVKQSAQNAKENQSVVLSRSKELLAVRQLKYLRKKKVKLLVSKPRLLFYVMLADWLINLFAGVLSGWCNNYRRTGERKQLLWAAGSDLPSFPIHQSYSCFFLAQVLGWKTSMFNKHVPFGWPFLYG